MTVATSTDEMRRFLLGDDTAAPDITTLWWSSMSGYAYATLPRHPQRATLRESFVLTAARHLAARDALFALLRAWSDVGIEAVVFKGFYLAEFVYPSGGQRAYADIDVVIDGALATKAFATAGQNGWDVVWRGDEVDDVLAVHGSEYVGHEVGQIRRPDIDVAIDLHRRAVHNTHNRVPASPICEQLTAAFRDAAVAIDRKDVTVRVPSPADAVVFGLALNRCWGSDAWQVKPRDFADLQALIARFGVTREAALQRARELGVASTVSTYLDRCDPWARRLELRRPSWWTLRRWNLRAAPERGHRDVVNLWMAFQDAIIDVVAVVRMAPIVRRAQRYVARATVPQIAHPAPITPPQGCLTTDRWRTYRRAIQRLVKLQRLEPTDAASVAALAGYEVMRSYGLGVSIDRRPRQDGRTEVRLLLGERVVTFTGADRASPGNSPARVRGDGATP